MLPTLRDEYGNEGSAHAYGWRASLLVEQARKQTADLLNAQINEIHFTSGATASIELAILHTLDTHAAAKPQHIITCVTEHKATLDACAEAARRGHEVTYLTTDNDGRITLDQITNAIKPNTRLVTLMHANNEIGTMHAIGEIGGKLRVTNPEILFHVDASQTAGRHEIDVERMNIDLLSLSAHKFHGPKGVGALFIRNSKGRRVHVARLHEGTANVTGIVGLGKAAELAKQNPGTEKMREQQQRILAGLAKEFAVGTARLNGSTPQDGTRLCNNISVTFKNVEPDELQLALKDIAYSSASACTGPLQSHVLKAIGQPTNDPFLTTARFGLSRLTTDEEVSFLIERLTKALETTRAKSKAYGAP